MAKKSNFRDGQAPKTIIVNLIDNNGKNWGTVTMPAKDFSTGSVGFYGNGQIYNPDNGEAKYQAGFTLTLCGSKPE